MLAEKFVTYTDSQGHLTGLPTLTPNEKDEVILLREQPAPFPVRNRPSPKLRGSATWIGDPTAPLYSEEELDEIDAELEQEGQTLFAAQEQPGHGHP